MEIPMEFCQIFRNMPLFDRWGNSWLDADYMLSNLIGNIKLCVNTTYYLLLQIIYIRLIAFIM